MHIYVYGSVCRGDILPSSDVDLLALVDGENSHLDSTVFSVYAYSQLAEMWSQGNPFAWHLALESRLVFAENGTDFVGDLGEPARYRNWLTDSKKFRDIYCGARDVLATRRDTTTFELSTVYLAVRNLAICFSLHIGTAPVFSRRAFELLGANSLELDPRSSKTLEDARILSTRGIGAQASQEDVALVISQLPKVERWMSKLLKEGASLQ